MEPVLAEEPSLITVLRQNIRDLPELIFRLECNLWTGELFVRISKPGQTARSKPIDIAPAIFGVPGSKHSEILQILVDILKEEGR
jgi:hypothetical protein